MLGQYCYKAMLLYSYHAWPVLLQSHVVIPVSCLASTVTKPCCYTRIMIGQYCYKAVLLYSYHAWPVLLQNHVVILVSCLASTVTKPCFYTRIMLGQYCYKPCCYTRIMLGQYCYKQTYYRMIHEPINHAIYAFLNERANLRNSRRYRYQSK